MIIMDYDGVYAIFEKINLRRFLVGVVSANSPEEALDVFAEEIGDNDFNDFVRTQMTRYEKPIDFEAEKARWSACSVRELTAPDGRRIALSPYSTRY